MAPCGVFRLGMRLTVALMAFAAPVAANEPSIRLTVPDVILVEPAATTPLDIRVGPPEALPRNAFVRLRGLPPAVTLSAGHMVTPGVWAVPLFALSGLKAEVPGEVSGRSEVSVSLVAIDGATLAETKAGFVVTRTALFARGTDTAPKLETDIPKSAATLEPPPPLPAGRPDRTQKAEPPAPPAQTVEPPAGAATLQPPIAIPPATTPPVQPPAPPPAAIVEPPTPTVALAVPSKEPPPAAAPPPPPPPVAAATPTPPPPPPAPPVAQPPPAPTNPALLLSLEERLRLEQIIGKGDRALLDGNVAQARQFYRHSADRGLAIAAFKMAETYDPGELSRLPVVGISGDKAEAKRWYQKALDLGDARAESRIARIDGR
jgi:hypothetical protein